MDQEQKDLPPSVPANTGGPRWNPTKEQIALLESLYKQGVRTPSAEQIQHITGKLREFGAIEGKNVFYWFQNHKARQRQKQKQQSFAYYTRLLRKSPQMVSPVHFSQLDPSFNPPMPCNNGVMCRPFFIPPKAGDLYYTQAQPSKAQYPAIFYPESFNKNPGIQLTQKTGNPFPVFQFPSNQDTNSVPVGRETLQLFPLHPSDKKIEEKSGNSLTYNSSSIELSENNNGGEKEEVGNENQYLVDFLGALNGSK